MTRLFRCLFPLLALSFLLLAPAQEPRAQAPAVMETIRNLTYRPDAKADPDLSKNPRCQLDLRYPKGAKGFSTLIWFHGGGLTGGQREFPKLVDPSIAIVSASYRLSPEAMLPEILDDAAEATAWTLREIAVYGGDPAKVFISGHSAGGYLAAMIGMDARWLAAKGVSNQKLAGIIPVSAQVTTHFHVKKLRGDTQPSLRPVIDEFAPLFYLSKDIPQVCLITGDRKIEFPSRVEENDFMAVSLRHLGHPMTEFHEVPGLDHGTINPGSAPFIEAFIKRVLAGREKK